MKAIVFTRPSTVELHEVDWPRPGPDEVIVKVAAAGICGSELHGIQHDGFRKPPLIMGHELSGVTADGRRVTVNPLLSCGSCDLCSIGSDHLCRHRAILGIHRAGAFAEAVAVPERALRVLDDSMTFEVAAMVEPLANAVHALRLAGPSDTDRIGIIGAGAIGLMNLLMALRHSPTVDVADLDPSRLAIAQRLGAERVGSTLDGEYEIVIDAVGAETTHRDSVSRLRPGGTAVWVGLLSSDAGFDGQEIVREEKRVLGSYCYSTADFDDALTLAADLPLDWNTSCPLVDGVEAFYELMAQRRDAVKVLLRPHG